MRGKHIPGLSFRRARVLVLTHVAQHLSVFRGSAGLEPFQMSLKGDVNESLVRAALSAPCTRVAPVGFPAAPGFLCCLGL